MAVGVDRLLIDWGVRNFFNTKITWSGSVLAPGWVSVLLCYNSGLNAVMDW